MASRQSGLKKKKREEGDEEREKIDQRPVRVAAKTVGQTPKKLEITSTSSQQRAHTCVKMWAHTGF